MELPSYQEHHLCPLVPNLEVYKECLALFVTPGCDEGVITIWSLWVMKGFGVSETWVKKYNGQTEERAIWSIGFTQNNDIMIIRHGDIMIAYSFEKQQNRYLEFDDNPNCWLQLVIEVQSVIADITDDNVIDNR
ncbi:F-box/kelch-repeat protein-like [Forsythia ovata]|uniref:F-box/kelch-repeat protein-like n=1 Tax=Forsythia ovata TaxID=205694 RepID=A0ABD1PY78_9LAMI